MADIATLADNFNDNSINGTLWSEWEDNATVTETNQQLEITPQGSVEADGSLYSNDTYDIDGSECFVEVVQVNNTSSYTDTQFALKANSDDYFIMEQENGTLYFSYYIVISIYYIYIFTAIYCYSTWTF